MQKTQQPQSRNLIKRKTLSKSENNGELSTKQANASLAHEDPDANTGVCSPLVDNPNHSLIGKSCRCLIDKLCHSEKQSEKEELVHD